MFLLIHGSGLSVADALALFTFHNVSINSIKIFIKKFKPIFESIQAFEGLFTFHNVSINSFMHKEVKA